MIVAVGGHSRKIGKTRTVCEIIRATPEADWTAVKISPHAHGDSLVQPILIEERTPGEETDSARYLEAGASRAFWLRATTDQMPHGLEAVSAANLLVESTSIVEFLEPDLFLFVADNSVEDWKRSARNVAHRADAVITGPVPPEVIEQIRKRLSVSSSNPPAEPSGSQTNSSRK